MKRSEMVNKILQIQMDTFSNINIVDNFEPEEIAEIFLSRLEQAGMLAPTVTKIEYHEKTGKQLLVETINKWEEE